MTTEKSENEKPGRLCPWRGCPHTASVETVQQLIILCGRLARVPHGTLIDLYP